jgi:hypothetical protein
VIELVLHSDGGAVGEQLGRSTGYRGSGKTDIDYGVGPQFGGLCHHPIGGFLAGIA